MRTNRKDIGSTYNSATGCTPGNGTSGCSEAGLHTNVCSGIQSRDAVEMYWSGMHFTHSLHTPCASSRKHKVSGAGCHTNVCTGTEEAQYRWVSLNKIPTKVVV